MAASSRAIVGGLVCCALLAACGAAWAAPGPADEAPAARAVLDALLAGVGRVEFQIDAVSAAADAAADRLRAGGSLYTRGDRGLAGAMLSEPGALMGLRPGWGEPGGGDVVVLAVGPGRAGAAEARALEARGVLVIVVGEWPAEPDGGGWRAAHAIRLDPGPADADAPRWPVAGVELAAAAWALECEVFAALTRRGETPVVRQSPAIDRRGAWWLRYGDQRFHHDRWLEPIEPGRLGRAYLAGLRRVLRDVGTASWDELARAGWRAGEARAAGGRIWLVSGVGLASHRLAGWLGDRTPGLAFVAEHDRPGTRDIVLALGADERPGSAWWGEADWFDGPAPVLWVVDGYAARRARLAKRDVAIDPWVPLGDAVVRVPHYDAPLGSVRGVVTEAIAWMVLAQADAAWRDQTRRAAR